MEKFVNKPITTELIPEKIILNRPAALALGHGLNQILTDKSDLILKHIDNLSSIMEHSDDAQRMHESLDLTLKLTERLQTSKVVLLTGKTSVMTNFEFSKEQEHIKANPQPGKLLLDEDLSERIISAINHNLYNKFTILRGFSHLIKGGSANNSVKKTATSIHELTDEILNGIPWYNNLNGRIQLGNRLAFHTDHNGNTKIDLLPPQKPIIFIS